MICQKCKMTEMRVEKVEDNIVYYLCLKCGSESTKRISEIESKESSE